MPRYSYDSQEGEREPLEDSNSYSRQPQQQQYQQPQYDSYQSQTSSPARPAHPGQHPESSFNRLRANRRYSRENPGGQAPYLATGAATAASVAGQRFDPVSPISPPQPPPHRDADGRYWGHELGYAPAPPSNITPGADNFSEAASGGISGIAYSVAERNARESGLEAMRDPSQPQQAHYGQQDDFASVDASPYSQNDQDGSLHPAAFAGGYPGDRDSHSSLAGLGAAAVPPGGASPGVRTPSRSPHSFNNEGYRDDPYQGYSAMPRRNLGVVNPNEIEDDGDDGLEYGRRGARTSMLSLGGSSNRSGHGGAAAAAGGAAAGAGVLGTLGGLVGRSANGRNGGASGQYNPVQTNTGYPAGDGSAYDLGEHGAEKPSDWLAKQNTSSKKWKWFVVAGVVLICIAAIVCGVIFGVVLKHKNGSSGSSQSASGDTEANGDLSLNSAEIQKLLNNPNLHKVFPGIDYTPINTQYPDCLKNPPSQNNVTRDVAVLSQLTNTIRLYGTDCNQTEMTLHALQQLKMDDTIKVWMGVWQDNNQTTNDRQLAQMWEILDKYGDKPFKGVIVANEILFRQQMTATELGTLLTSVRNNITAKGMSLPVATSDLGDSLTADLVSQSDYVMANIHPFFAGANAKDAAAWTYNFWQVRDGTLFKSDASKNIISETGWPSQGGTDCGTDTVTDCPNGSVAGIDEMNQFMDDWVCQALTNGTQYFWFEAFDEPWKIQFDQGEQNWEDHWGLMDVDRNLKAGVKIPDCGGKTVS